MTKVDLEPMHPWCLGAVFGALCAGERLAAVRLKKIASKADRASLPRRWRDGRGTLRQHGCVIGLQ